MYIKSEDIGKLLRHQTPLKKNLLFLLAIVLLSRPRIFFLSRYEAFRKYFYFLSLPIRLKCELRTFYDEISTACLG